MKMSLRNEFKTYEHMQQEKKKDTIEIQRRHLMAPKKYTKLQINKQLKFMSTAQMVILPTMNALDYTERQTKMCTLSKVMALK